MESSDRVGAGIERLEERFGSFPVNQTTLTATERDFETFVERADAGTMDVYVRVRNEDGEVLHLRGDDGTVPWYVSTPDESLARRIREEIRAETGVECRVDDVVRVTIAGVHREDGPEDATVYRLGVLVDATYEGGTPDGAVWRAGEPSLPEYV